ncbi:MAG: histidine phosphatase family protein [Thermodesulfobacteriota bacterium]
MGMDGPPGTTFGLLRHGQTIWNREGRIQGQDDSPLSPEGERQCLAWGKRLREFPWERILVSDLGRARRTADLVNESLGVPVTVDQRLREQDWGRWRGLTLRQITTDSADELERQVNAGWHFRPPDGENRLHLLERSRLALADAARQYEGQTILVITHEGVIKALLNRLSNRMFLPGEGPLMEPLHLHFLRHDGRELHLLQINAVPLKNAETDTG